MKIFTQKTAAAFFTVAVCFFSQAEISPEEFFPAGGVAGESPAEGEEDRTAGGPGNGGEASPAENADINLGHVYSLLDSPEVEQRQVFDSEDISNSHTESLIDFLQSEGIQILSYGPYGLESKPQLRGFTDETVRVVIDGICVNNAQYGTFDFTSINVSDIERLEIVRGGFTEGVSDEGSVAGTVYITTKKQSLGTSFNADVYAKSFLNAEVPLDTFSLGAGVSSQVLENTFLKVNLRGTYAVNEFQYRNYAGKISSRKDADVKDVHADSKVSHYFGNGSSITAGLMLYDGIKNCPGSKFASVSGVQTDLDSMVTLSLVNPSVKEMFRLENNAAWIFNRRTYDEGNSSSLHRINTFKYASYASVSPRDFYEQSAGLTADLVLLDSTDDGNHAQLSLCFKETSSFKIGDHITLTFPLALKTCGENAAFIPKAGVKLSFEWIDFMIDGYRMVQFPNMDDMYWNGSGGRGNPDLKKEEGWGGEVSVNWKKLLPFNVSLFTNYYKNKIQWASRNGTYMPQNVASAFYCGFDFRTELSFLEGLFDLTANTEYLYCALLDKDKPLTYKKRIMWTPDWTAAVCGTVNFRDFRASLEWNYMGKRYVSNLNESFMDPYYLVNINVSYEGFEMFTPYLRGENILDAEYESVASYPMPGISLTLGLKFKY